MVGVIATGAIALAIDSPQDKTKADAKQAGKKGPMPEFKSNKDKASFAIGLNIGRTILQDFGRADAIDTDQFVKGLKAGLANDQSMDKNDIRAAIIEYREEAIKQDAGKFLTENKKKEGIKTTASGLQYQVLKSGDAGGKSPTKESTVKVHYTGTLVNGTKFDSSVDRGEPAEFQVGGVVPGWTEALQLMKVGDKWRLYLPPELGYGAQGKGPVPPHAVMIFEVELLEVK
jgi:FKBP-type peptidyl-prolyl cis-trans isomerase